MLQVAQSIRAGRISPSTVLRKLGTASRKNKLYFAFRELGRVIRTTFLLDYIGDEDLRRIIQAAQNKCEGFNNFAQWAYFGADTITQALKELQTEGMKLTPELLAGLSPYRTHHLNRFGLYEMKERHPLPVDYGVGFET